MAIVCQSRGSPRPYLYGSRVQNMQRHARIYTGPAGRRLISNIFFYFAAETVNSKSKCYGDFFSERLCFSGSHIWVTGADFGDSYCETGACCPDVSYCNFSVSATNRPYYNQILSFCNNKTSCHPLKADWSQTPGESECYHSYSDFVTIYFQCLTSKG